MEISKGTITTVISDILLILLPLILTVPADQTQQIALTAATIIVAILDMLYPEVIVSESEGEIQDEQ